MNHAPPSAGLAGSAYLAMARLFSYPDADNWQAITARGLVWPEMTQEDLEAEYLAAFEVGRDSAPIPLFEGMHRPDTGRDGVLQDLLRFYEYFDIKLSTAEREYPDHLATELEFLAWMCMQEEATQHEGSDAEPLRRAQRDFISRHIDTWLPALCQRLDATGTAYARFAAVLAELVGIHRSRLATPPQTPGDVS